MPPKHRHALLPLSIALAVATASGVTHAENSDKTLLQEQVVTGSKRLPQIVVVADTEQEQLQAPGSIATVDAQELESSRVYETGEALRKMPGINVRDEEGFGMRPNIGMRGLNPTRSTKVLLLEDGIPAAYAPYGDNASYYHAPVERYERIEVMKGSNTLRFGPQTVGGAINYVTPAPRRQAAGGFVSLTAGDHDYHNTHIQGGGEGHLVDVMHKQGDGARDNTHLKQTDINYKTVLELNEVQALTLRANYLNEDSQVTYSGITDAELANFGEDYNPFGNDRFFMDRYGLSATHFWQLADNTVLNTNVYGSIFSRDWWRQSSTTSDTQCGVAFRNARAAGDAVNPDACNSIQGRLRDYHTWGMEPRLTLTHGLGELETGVRWHEESQWRVQRNAASSDHNSDNYNVSEKNDRTTEALSAFVQNRFDIGRLAVTPAVRHEQIDNARRNALNGDQGEAELGEWVPGIGFNYLLTDDIALYGGVHEGFAPPRVEDMITTAGGSVDVNPEHSINREIGIRGQVSQAVALDATWFSNAFSNQIAVGSVAGGSTPLAEGEARYEGLEVALDINAASWFDSAGEPYGRLAWTHLPVAEQENAFRRVDNGAVVGNSGDDLRMPYAPEDNLTARVGYRQGSWDGSVEAVYIGEQYADFANTENPVAGGNGQVGKLDSYTVYNAVLNYQLPDDKATLFVAVKNIDNESYIVDRTRGIQTGNPRLAQVGIKIPF